MLTCTVLYQRWHASVTCFVLTHRKDRKRTLEANSEGHLTMQVGLEECIEALVALVCHPAIIDNSIKDHPFMNLTVEVLLKCQDLLGFGAAAALTV